MLQSYLDHYRDTPIDEPFFGEWLDGARDVVERGKKRLSGFDGGAGDKTDPPPLPPIVDQLHAAGQVTAPAPGPSRSRSGRPARL